MDNNQFKCQACGGSFSSQDELMKHAQEAHQKAPKAEGGMKCPVCGFAARTPEEIEQHKKESMNDPKHQMSGNMDEHTHEEHKM